MAYEVRWTRPAVRDLSQLPPRIAAIILTYVDERLAIRPTQLSKPLRGALEGLRTARSGDYRVLFRLDEGQSVIFVRRVDHRAHVYHR